MPFYDNYALKQPTNIGKKLKTILNQKIFDQLVTSKEKKLRILEIGVGHGFFADICVNNGLEFFGVEPNETMYKWLTEKGLSVKQCVCPPIPYDSNFFDLVYCGYVLENIKDPKSAYDFLLEIFRVLKPEGRLGIVSSDYMKMGKEFWNVSYMNSFVTTERRIKQLFIDTGFEFQKSIFFSGVIFGPARYLPYLFYKIYNYNFLARLFGKHKQTDSIFYKFRVTFPESFLVIGKKPNVN